MYVWFFSFEKKMFRLCRNNDVSLSASIDTVFSGAPFGVRPGGNTTFDIN